GHGQRRRLWDGGDRSGGDRPPSQGPRDTGGDERRGAEQPVLEPRHRRHAEDAIAADPIAGVCTESILVSNPEAFQDLIKLSLAHAKRVMEIELDPDHKN